LFGASTPAQAIEIMKREWSLSPEAEAEFEKLKGNVESLRTRRKG
jgi:hypothetical protein